MQRATCLWCRSALRLISTSAAPRKWTSPKSAGNTKNRVRNSENVSEEPEKPLHGSSSFKKGATQPDFKELPPSMRRKYRLFTDEAEEILDSAQAQWVEIEAPEEEEFDEFEGLNLQRGKTGVLDIEDLVHVLNLENADDICVIKIPPETKYADYIVLASGHSARQIIGIAEFVRRYYKVKKDPQDPFIENNVGITRWRPEWIALDLGNIVLHVMQPEVRKKYDIECLWAVGQEHDPLSQSPKTTFFDLVKQHSSVPDQKINPTNSKTDNKEKLKLS